MESDPTKLTARQLAAAIASGACSAQEAARSFLDRIDAVDSSLDAVVEVNPAATEIARQCDESLARGEDHGPLHGVPVVLKANIDTGDDMATSAGSLALANHRAIRDAPCESERGHVSSSTIAAVAGYPSVALPWALVDHLPVAVSFIGLPGSETDLIGMAMASEEARGAFPSPGYSPGD